MCPGQPIRRWCFRFHFLVCILSTHTHTVHVWRVLHTNGFVVDVLCVWHTFIIAWNEMNSFTVVLLLHMYLTAGVTNCLLYDKLSYVKRVKLMRCDANVTLFYYLSLTASFTTDSTTVLTSHTFVWLLQVLFIHFIFILLTVLSADRKHLEFLKFLKWQLWLLVFQHFWSYYSFMFICM